MPKDKYRKPEITHGIKRDGQRTRITVTGRHVVDGIEMHNFPKPRPIPILSKLGKVLGHCFAPQAHYYG